VTEKSKATTKPWLVVKSHPMTSNQEMQ